MNDALSDVRYWADRIEEIVETTRPIQDTYALTHKLDTLEIYALHNSVRDFTVASTLLNNALARLENTPKKSFWKSLFHRN